MRKSAFLIIFYFFLITGLFLLIRWFLTLPFVVFDIASLFLLFFLVGPSLFKRKRWKLLKTEQKEDLRVCIMIPAKNEEKVINNTLKSLLELKYSNFYVVVINDGSTDATHDIVESYADNEKVFLVDIPIDAEHHGKAYALNKGYELFDADILLILDADVIVKPDFLNNVLSPFSDPEIMAVQSSIKAYDYSKNFVSKLVGYDLEFTNIVMYNFLPFKSFGTGILLRKRVVDELFPLEVDSISEDEQTSVFIQKKKYKGCYVFNDFIYEAPVSSLKTLYKQRSRWFLGSLKELFSKYFFSFAMQALILFTISAFILLIFIFPFSPPTMLSYSFIASFFIVSFLEKQRFKLDSPIKVTFYTLLSYLFNLIIYDLSFFKLILYHDKKVTWYKTPR